MTPARSQYRPNRRRSKEVLAILDSALYGGAIAVRDAIDDEFASRNNGFKDGTFATDMAANANVISLPFTKDGVRRIRVQNVATRDSRPYPVFWEFKHYNIYTRRTESNPLYEPAMMRAIPFVLPNAARQVKRGRTTVGTETTRGSIEVRVE
jgi:hypothetical protein